MAANRGSNSAFGRPQEFSTNFGLPSGSPFSFPSHPSPFVGHFYPVVNSDRTIIPLPTPESSLSSQSPAALLVSVAARRTDLLYREFYKNLLKSASKSQNLKQISANVDGDKLNTESKGPPDYKEESTECLVIGSGVKETARFDPLLRLSPFPLRSFYEGVYNRLSPADSIFRFRTKETYGCRTSPPDDLTAKPISHWDQYQTFRGHNSLAHPNDFLPRPVLKTKPSGFSSMATTATGIQDSSPFDVKLGFSSDFSPIESTKGDNASDGHTAQQQSCRNSDNYISEKQPGSLEPSAASDRLKRKRRSTIASETCPICGVTVRESEMKQHFASEVAKLGKLAQEIYRNSKRTIAFRKSSCSQSKRGLADSFIQATTNSRKHEDGNDQRDFTFKENRSKTFQKVRANRLDRFNSKVGQCRESLWKNGEIPGDARKLSEMLLDYGRGGTDDVQCPMCDLSLSPMTTPDQISDHVVRCVGPKNASRSDLGNGAMNEGVDTSVKTEDCGFEEYEWCGQTRVRATALVHRDLLVNAPGFHVVRNAENEDSDQDLNVESDETFEFGSAQFTDRDLIESRCSSDKDLPFSSGSPSCSEKLERTSSSPISNQGRLGSYVGNSLSQSPSVVQALRMRIIALEGSSKENHCLICMESYKNPLVSIQCWHVHCEECWMRALGVKKLCPQCNIITSVSHLRRIFL